MKYKDILLATVISFAVIGCGDSSNLDRSLVITKSDSHNIIKAKVFDYMFLSDSNFYKNDLRNGSALLTDNFHNLTLTIRKAFKEVGLDIPKNPREDLGIDNQLHYHVNLNNPDLYQKAELFDSRLVKELINVDFKLLRENPTTIEWYDFTRALCSVEYEGRPLVRTGSYSWEYLIKRSETKTKDVETQTQETIAPLSTNTQSKFSEEVDLETLMQMELNARRYRPWERAGGLLVPMGGIHLNQWEEWNQIIINTLAQDPFFSQFFRPQTLPDATGSVSLLAARTGKTGLDAAHLTVNGVPGSHIDLGLQVFVQLKGSVDHGKSTNLTTGTVAYKLGNTLIGAIQTYSNSGTGFGVDGRQLESSVVASHSFGSFFIEGQLGSISATDVHFNDWSGSRAQLTVGIDTPWVSPFVQVSYRNLNDQPDTTVYGGLEVDLSELRTDSYAFSTHLLTKAGYSNVKGTTGVIEWSGTLTLKTVVCPSQQTLPLVLLQNRPPV